MNINLIQLKSMEISTNLIKSTNQIIKTSEKRVGGRGEACKLMNLNQTEKTKQRSELVNGGFDDKTYNQNCRC